MIKKLLVKLMSINYRLYFNYKIISRNTCFKILIKLARIADKYYPIN